MDEDGGNHENLGDSAFTDGDAGEVIFSAGRALISVDPDEDDRMLVDDTTQR